MCYQKHRCTCKLAGRPPLLVEPIFLGTELKKKFLDKNWKKKIFKNHEQFEKKIARATGKGVVSITVVPPRASSQNPWVISLKCCDPVHQLANLYDELVSTGESRPVTGFSCSGKPLAPNLLVREIRWHTWPPMLSASQ